MSTIVELLIVNNKLKTVLSSIHYCWVNVMVFWQMKIHVWPKRTKRSPAELYLDLLSVAWELLILLHYLIIELPYIVQHYYVLFVILKLHFKLFIVSQSSSVKTLTPTDRNPHFGKLFM